MTPPKTLSPAEALRALAEGTRLAEEYAAPLEYIYLAEDGSIRRNRGGYYNCEFVGLTKYTEPKPKRKLAPYYVEYDNGSFVAEIKRLEMENAKLRAVVEAAKELVQEHYIDATCKNCTGETNHVEQLLENLERLETTNG